MAFAFKTMDGKIKNKLVDRLQSNFKITDFLASQAEHIDGKYLEGLNRDNVEFVRKTCETSCISSRQKGRNRSGQYLQGKVLNIEGWAQDHFGSKPDFSLSHEDLMKLAR